MQDPSRTHNGMKYQEHEKKKCTLKTEGNTFYWGEGGISW